MPEIHAARRERARQQIAETGADAALITAAPNVRYLTGLASSNAALLLLASGPAVLATDSRYALAAQRDCPDLELVVERFIEPRLAAEMTSRALRAVAFEAHEMSVERHAELATAAAGVTTVPFGRKIEELRTAKDPSELELLATACRISAQAIADTFALIRPGLTERQLAAALALLEKDIRSSLEGRISRIYERNSEVVADPKAPMGHLEDDKEREARSRASGPFGAHINARGFKPKDALDQLVREIAFTHLNRFCAFKMMRASRCLHRLREVP